MIYLKGVFAKNERGYGLRQKYSIVIASNFNSICCVNKEKIFKNDAYQKKRPYSILIQKVAIFDSDRKTINLIPNT